MYFMDGEVSEIKLLHLDVHENCELCEGYASFIYDIKSTNRPDRYKALWDKSTYSGRFEDIKRFEVL